MLSIVINVGDAFLIDTPPNSQHLYIAIAQTSENQFLFVNVTTRRENSETACILLPGPDMLAFVTHESVVAYKYAREISIEELAVLVTPGSPIPKDTCSPSVLIQIQQGGLISKRLKNRYKIALRAFLGL
ncbi:MAG: hypothetical protein HC860_16025 [Alkalinema sp. RU_4_3]|nr:hypothetical protein [Alkalinema sp. RU_4_3]